MWRVIHTQHFKRSRSDRWSDRRRGSAGSGWSYELCDTVVDYVESTPSSSSVRPRPRLALEQDTSGDAFGALDLRSSALEKRGDLPEIPTNEVGDRRAPTHVEIQTCPCVVGKFSTPAGCNVLAKFRVDKRCVSIKSTDASARQTSVTKVDGETPTQRRTSVHPDHHAEGDFDLSDNKTYPGDCQGRAKRQGTRVPHSSGHRGHRLRG